MYLKDPKKKKKPKNYGKFKYFSMKKYNLQKKKKPSKKKPKKSFKKFITLLELISSFNTSQKYVENSHII